MTSGEGTGAAATVLSCSNLEQGTQPASLMDWLSSWGSMCKTVWMSSRGKLIRAPEFSLRSNQGKKVNYHNVTLDRKTSLKAVRWSLEQASATLVFRREEEENWIVRFNYSKVGHVNQIIWHPQGWKEVMNYPVTCHFWLFFHKIICQFKLNILKSRSLEWENLKKAIKCLPSLW